MKLNIFTLTWNAQDKLLKLKESLIPSLSGIDYTWFIKDNKSSDNTVAMGSDWGDNVKVIPYDNNNQNFSEGMNYLFEYAKPNDKDLVLLLNNDVVFKDKNSLKLMIESLKKDNGIGVVGARLLYTNTNKLQHAGVVFNHFKNPLHFRLKEESDLNSKKNKLFQVVTGAVLLTKAEYYKNICKDNKSGINGMDEKYHWAFDDVDMCLSIKYNLGKNILYCGGTEVFHEESASLKKNPANLLFMNHNLNILKNKWYNRCVSDLDIYSKDPSYNLYKEGYGRKNLL